MKINTLVSNRKRWFRGAFKFKYSIFGDVWEKCIFFALVSLIICIFYNLGFPVQQPILSSLIPTIVLGLLLAFRTNSANDRFWEGRKLWGGIVNNIRNLTWQIWVNITVKTTEDQEQKIQALNLLTVFAIASKNHLRSQGITEEIYPLLSEYHYHHLSTSQHLPLQTAAYLGEYLFKEYEKGNLNQYQLVKMQQLVNDLVNLIGGCERILKTPIPRSYSIHLKQLLLIYCLVLPFQLVDQINWWTIPFVSLVSYVVYGIEAIALEIENPFGTDTNDLPLDQICQNINKNIQDFILNQKR